MHTVLTEVHSKRAADRTQAAAEREPTPNRNGDSNHSSVLTGVGLGVFEVMELTAVCMVRKEGRDGH